MTLNTVDFPIQKVSEFQRKQTVQNKQIYWAYRKLSANIPITSYVEEVEGCLQYNGY